MRCQGLLLYKPGVRVQGRFIAQALSLKTPAVVTACHVEFLSGFGEGAGLWPAVM